LELLDPVAMQDAGESGRPGHCSQPWVKATDDAGFAGIWATACFTA